MVKTGNRPQLNFEKVTIDHINVKRQLKGKGEWQDLEVTLYDPIVPSAAQAVMEWVRLGHESITGRDGYADFYKKDIDIFMLGPVGDKVEQWKLIGAFPTQVNFGDLDASSNEVATVTMTLTYDYAILEF
jgi:phage tail-like protein